MGMFDQSPIKTKLVLVHSETTEVFANYLQMLISSKDDVNGEIVGVEDGSVETTVWSEKEYAAQKPTLSSVDHILFIGRGKTLSKETYGMKPRFERYGMSYGWLGKHAFLRVSGESLKKDELFGFFELAKEYDPEFDEVKLIGTDVPGSAKNKGVPGFFKKAAQLTFGGPAIGTWMMVKDKYKDKIRSGQYHTVIHIFYQDGIADFLKE